MYMLRLISAVLHQEVGSAVPDAALDLRPGELAIVVPLVACLLALSAWPAAVSEHSFPTKPGGATFRPPATPATPHGTMLNEGPTTTTSSTTMTFTLPTP
jgi:hypothetical protein